ncbi:putative FK506-binding protein [Seiridium cardinale]|uniref:FK506-binding protein n=1 Tax=Seiridium cardinale TaxID=138064 RepID=A0ABR2X7Q4_9PEZI
MATVALYGLEVPPVGVLVPAQAEDSIPNASYRITMAALDPTEAPEADEEGNIPDKPRATLKLVRQRYPDLDDELDDEYLEALMGGSDDDEDDSDEDEANGGPSDPSKSKRAKAEAALQKLIEAAQEEGEEDSDDEMADADGKSNGVKKAKKGKEPATSSDDDDDESVDSDAIDLEEFVICTLDTERNYQQPIDITIGPDEKVFFRVTGTHAIHLTGNYVIDGDEDSEDDSEDEDYDDFPNQLEEMYGEGSDGSEEDELDGLEDPRITEVESEEEAPKLVKAKKGKNKRSAEEEGESLDALIAKADAAEDKTSKKQQKKLKNNKGEAVEVEKEKAKADAKESPKDAKKVQFAKNLEQGPTGPAANAEKGATPGVKVVKGVTIDDRKIGKGRPAKNGNKVGVRYIGKLQDGKVFDSNKKGKPFTFAIGKGEVIQGWEIGLEGMQVGGERRITIPPKLAYGSRSQPGIPGNSTLVFDIKLLEIK